MNFGVNTITTEITLETKKELVVAFGSNFDDQSDERALTTVTRVVSMDSA